MSKKEVIVTKTEHFGIARKIVAHMTTRSWTEIPHISMIYEPDVTDFLVAFKKLQAKRAEEGKSKVTLNTIMLKLLVQGIKACPVMNATLEFNPKNVTGKLEYREDIDVSIPWLLPSGEMMTICIHDIQNDTIDELNEKIAEVGRKVNNTNMTEAMYEISFDQTLKDLKGFNLGVFRRIIAAKTGKGKIQLLKGEEKKKYYQIPKEERITLDDIRQGTITISNMGSVMRGLSSGAISMLDVIPPQVCVIGFCSTLKKALCIKQADGSYKVEPRDVIPITIAGDHRAMDGGDLVPFYHVIEGIFANPDVIFDW